MKRKLSLIASLLISGLATTQSLAAEPRFGVIFDEKEGKYEVIRTPQLLVTKTGAFLAFAQGRSTTHDRGDNDIILKRSSDGGETWSPIQVVADQNNDSLNSICVIQLPDTGRILIVGCWFPDGYEMMDFKYLSPGMQGMQRRAGRENIPAIKAGYEGRDIQRNYVIHSDDDGRTWSPFQDITREVKRPAPDFVCVPGPGVAIQLREGPHGGRIVVPCWTRWLDTKGDTPTYRYAAYAIFSDDSGQKWQRGDIAPDGKAKREQHCDETQMVELPGGTILLNARGAGGRNIATSRDGGQTWSALVEEKAIPTTPTAAGYIRFSGLGDGAKSRLLFSNPAEEKRKEGVISLSYDDAKTWPVQRKLRPGKFSYSALARLPDGGIACIFDGSVLQGEIEGHKGAAVMLARFTLDWLTEGSDKLP